VRELEQMISVIKKGGQTLEEPEHCRSFLLRLPVSIKKKAALLAMEEGISLNHFISLAVSNFVLKIERDRQSDLHEK